VIKGERNRQHPAGLELAVLIEDMKHGPFSGSAAQPLRNILYEI